MRYYKGSRFYSASDLVNFLGCAHRTTLDLIHLDSPMEQAEDDEQAQLLAEKGLEHERAFLQRLAESGKRVVDIGDAGRDQQGRFDATLAAMASGVDVIYQGTLLDGCLAGHADFLMRVEHPSRFGPYGYEVYDTKLARSAQAKHVVQLGFYSRLLEHAQGSAPVMMHIALGDGTVSSHRVADYAHYLAMAQTRFLERVEQGEIDTFPEPCESCGFCPWRERCDAQWIETDHLSQVAGITRLQIHKLETAGVTTLRELALLPSGWNLAKLQAETLAKLRAQAALQLQARQTGGRQLELLPLDPDGMRGFARLPRPDPGDLFFDMEGDPLEIGGLEYLFGVYWHEGEQPRFKALWAHDRGEERIAFEQFMDFVGEHLRRHPAAHIYHYAAYEETALKKLMSLHATREAQVDNLLRRRKLVDLYKVVREGLRVSEPRYSIKNIEHFYLDARQGDVTNAGASIVYYERWKTTRDPKLLKDIEDYNHDDVRSTYELRQWLLGLRPEQATWFDSPQPQGGMGTAEVDAATPAEQRLEDYRQRLAVHVLPKDRADWSADDRFRLLVWELLGFHARAARPAWWAMFSRMDMEEDELIEDGESLGGLILEKAEGGTGRSRNPMLTYRFPQQETKLKTGDGAVLLPLGRPVSSLTVDEATLLLSFRCKLDPDEIPARAALGPAGPIRSDVLNAAIYRFADSVIAGDGGYPALRALLRLDLPKLKGRTPGLALVPEESGTDAIIDAVAALDQSYLYIQGPPGAGKTYTGSHVIVELLRRGCTIGVTSNSHKAINNLLAAVEDKAKKRGIEFHGMKKCSGGKTEQEFDGDFMENVSTNKDVFATLGFTDVKLAAGTAWLFSDPEMNQKLDYLFVDEAGQVALANLVVMGVSARNIVLLGDQMQLGQPIQGVHPGRSGESSLEYLLGGLATIPPERGIFLATTWRMHADVCRFISDAVYDGRLRPEPNNANQALVLGSVAHPALLPTGVRFIAAEHDGCRQRSEEEAGIVAELLASLLQQGYRDKKGVEYRITLDDVLVVAPYNMQVNLLKKTLPEGARVGTVDKFQGQEAEVVIVSMATSSQEYLPRHMEFLYSRNRLNVAVSRARCLAVVVANPKLLEIDCSTPEQMELVNTLCWLYEYGALPQ